jgi:hypothetical protein
MSGPSGFVEQTGSDIMFRAAAVARDIPDAPEGPVYQCQTDGGSPKDVKIMAGALNYLPDMGNKNLVPASFLCTHAWIPGNARDVR